MPNPELLATTELSDWVIPGNNLGTRLLDQTYGSYVPLLNEACIERYEHIAEFVDIPSGWLLGMLDSVRSRLELTPDAIRDIYIESIVRLAETPLDQHVDVELHTLLNTVEKARKQLRQVIAGQQGSNPVE